MVDLVEAWRLGTSVVLGDGSLPAADGVDDALVVSAEHLVEALLSVSPGEHRHPRVELSGAVVEGSLDLSGASVTASVLLRHCRFTHDLRLGAGSWAGDLDLHGSHVGTAGSGSSIAGQGIRVAGDLALGHVVTTGGVDLRDAVVEGSVGVFGGHLGADGGVSLDARGARVEETLFVMLDQVMEGALVLAGAQVTGRLVLRDVRLGVQEEGVSLDGDGLRVGAEVLADHGLEADGAVLLRGAEVHRGVHLGGARLGAGSSERWAGQSLDATGARASRIDLDRGFETSGTVVLVRAATGVLDIQGARLGADSSEGAYAGVSLHADQLQVDGHLLARNVRASGGARLMGARVGGQVVMAGSRLGAGEAGSLAPGTSLDLSASTAGELVLGPGFASEGVISVVDASVHRLLDLRGAELGAAARGTGLAGVSLAGDGLQTTDVLADASTSTAAAVRLVTARVAGNVSFVGSSVGPGARGGMSVDLEGADIEGSAFLRDGLRCASGIGLYRTHVGGVLELTGARLGRSDAGRDLGLSLMAQNAEVAGAVFAEGLETAGALHLVGAHVVGLVDLRRSRLGSGDGDSPAAGTSVFATSLRADQGVSLASADCAGAVHLSHATVTQNLVLTGARLGRSGAPGSPSGASLKAERLVVDGNLLMKEATTVSGVTLVAAQVSGQLNLSGSSVGVGPPGTATTGISVEAEGVVVQGTMLLRDGFTCEGVVRLRSGHVAQGLDLTGAVLDTGGHHGAGASLDGENLRVDHALVVRDGFSAPGGMRLSLAKLATLSVDADESGLPCLHNATGWRLGDVFGVLRRDRRAAARWLAGQPALQPWHELAAAYERNGQAADGRWLRYRAAVAATRKAPWPSRVGRTVSRMTTGHGYYPLLALAWLAVVFVLAWSATAYWSDDFTTPATEQIVHAGHGTAPGRVPNSACTPSWDVPCLHDVAEAMTIALPVSPADQPWDPPYGTIPTLVFALLKGASWVFTALLLAGITGLLRTQ